MSLVHIHFLFTLRLLLSFLFFFFNDTATTEIYTLSLHDALPIFQGHSVQRHVGDARGPGGSERKRKDRSEEHTSELQSHLNLVCRLLLEKKKKNEEDLSDSMSYENLARESTIMIVVKNAVDYIDA